MSEPIPMILCCPQCTARHIDEGEFATKPHHTHACQTCGFVWRPAVVPTVGVQFLPGYKNVEQPAAKDAALRPITPEVRGRLVDEIAEYLQGAMFEGRARMPTDEADRIIELLNSR